jgi:hypothetical protein
VFRYVEWPTGLQIVLLVSIALAFVSTLRRFRGPTGSVTVTQISLALAFVATAGLWYASGKQALTEEFNRTVLFAQGDSRPALDQLRKWAKDSSYPFADAADKAWVAVIDSHEEFPEIDVPLPWYPLPWREDFDPAAFSLSELWSRFSPELPRFRVGVLCFIWRKDDVPLRNRLSVLVEVMRSDSSLEVVAHAGQYFKHGSNDGFKNLDVEGHLSWWEAHKNDVL